MKNYYYKLVYIFSIIELLFIVIFTALMFKAFRVNVSDIITIVIGLLMLVILFVILLKIKPLPLQYLPRQLQPLLFHDRKSHHKLHKPKHRLQSIFFH